VSDISASVQHLVYLVWPTPLALVKNLQLIPEVEKPRDGSEVLNSLEYDLEVDQEL
jgi:hypothetical protein